jgi:hypothetical protein
MFGNWDTIVLQGMLYIRLLFLKGDVPFKITIEFLMNYYFYFFDMFTQGKGRE